MIHNMIQSSTPDRGTVALGFGLFVNRRLPPLCSLCCLLFNVLLIEFAVAAPRPNIVVIMSDDMGFSDIGCYGGEIQTPTLDRLAAGGLRLTQFYNTARCCPTRASLLTGLYPHQAGIGHMMEDRGLEGYRGDLNRRCVTMAEVLRPAGYGTYATGKWHVTKATQPDGRQDNWPLQRGFDRFYGTITGAGNFYDPGTLTRDNTMISPYADAEYKPKQYYYTDAISDHAVRFIGDHHRSTADKPLFLYITYTAAHWPMHALEEDIAKYKGKYDGGYEPIRRARLERAKKLGLIAADAELSPTAGDWSKVENKAWEARCMEVYAAMIDRMDQGIARIVAELERTGRLNDTLIFFMQDNGGCAETVGRQLTDNVPIERPAKPPLAPLAADFIDTSVRPTRTRDGYHVRTGPGAMPGPHDTFIAYGQGWANVSNTPHREYKHWVHEGGISTPLIVHWPAAIKRRGELVKTPGHLIDIMATCVDVSGAKYPKEQSGQATQPPEGKSLVPAFDGKPIEREAIYWEHEGNRALRAGNWKLVAKGPAGAWELYDIERDRAELHDLAAKEPQRVTQMVGQWEAWARRANVLPWIWQPQYGEKPSAENKSKKTKNAKKANKTNAATPQP
jgi:arylsulfatase A-like enzyme